ncbi:hypothetical protein BE04_07760 [Sorangium cellulosum]|uniref:Uncharacterized protein n=1 Tax=Sorangium cellulosum TaxID=56 RepID=A0A150P452_SORCE|nr:hypothetical protein BE04_07760 [Sorangium cellulosum]
MRSSLVHALFQPPSASIHASNCFVGTRRVPMNMRCSNRCAKPVRPGSSNREPTLTMRFRATIGSA